MRPQEMGMLSLISKFEGILRLRLGFSKFLRFFQAEGSVDILRFLKIFPQKSSKSSVVPWRDQLGRCLRKRFSKLAWIRSPVSAVFYNTTHRLTSGHVQGTMTFNISSEIQNSSVL